MINEENYEGIQGRRALPAPHPAESSRTNHRRPAGSLRAVTLASVPTSRLASPASGWMRTATMLSGPADAASGWHALILLPARPKHAR